MKLGLACVVLLASCTASAAAADDRAAQPLPAALIASTAPTAPPADTTVPTTNAVVPVLPLAPPIKLITLKTAPTEHKFLDLRNSLAFSAVAASLAADSLSTQRGLAYPGFYEMNPLARPFVKTRAGAAAYSAASFSLLAGAMYLAHKTHHHRIERILPFAVAGWEGLLSARNYHVIATRGR
jgi:hypothetical protein